MAPWQVVPQEARPEDFPSLPSAPAAPVSALLKYEPSAPPSQIMHPPLMLAQSRFGKCSERMRECTRTLAAACLCSNLHTCAGKAHAENATGGKAKRGSRKAMGERRGSVARSEIDKRHSAQRRLRLAPQLEHPWAARHSSSTQCTWRCTSKQVHVTLSSSPPVLAPLPYLLCLIRPCALLLVASCALSPFRPPRLPAPVRCPALPPARPRSCPSAPLARTYSAPMHAWRMPADLNPPALPAAPNG